MNTSPSLDDGNGHHSVFAKLLGAKKTRHVLSFSVELLPYLSKCGRRFMITTAKNVAKERKKVTGGLSTVTPFLRPVCGMRYG